MPFMHPPLLYFLLHFFAGNQASEPSAETKMVEPTKEAEATNVILQSKDGGHTWQDISHGLPEIEERMGFFAGESEIYLSTNGALYRSKSNLKTHVWEKENVPDLKSTSITFNQSGVMAYSFDGHIYRKKPSSDTWLPIYTDLITHSVATIFETSDGTVFMGTGKSLSKSTDKAQSWKPVQKGWVDNIVESEGVLLATGQQGIMRSTDNGDTWEWVISEGGVGIAVERIDGGFAAIAYNTRTQSRRIHTSFDGGKTWQAIDEGLQPSKNISSVKQMGNYLFVGHPDGIFRSSDMGNTWQRVHAGFGNPLYASLKFALWTPAAPVEKVFKLYVSGNVLYAVAVSPGC
ncbi:exo-alpha-sialidase [uncultured Imperialibacter sp.]|uniref:WD40/YVTN/BNR-like repeat-containing protein n=1 Tax=uncultured Imperialibacter sp. TaxID=1672639 RepID=UPI0030D88395|tara:strand:+ start:28887 stop:29924 length:1038 start_codon:yes stop_codon:yes gene_type:complete